jgi:heptose III glucuronosyltransferase
MILNMAEGKIKMMIVKDEITLSIIIPVYNVEQYLAQCLDSIFVHQQINDRIEVIVVNDGSTDGSLSILKEYKKNYDFILITQKSSGPGGARNTGIKSAQGRYLLFIDSDDFIIPGALDKLLIYLSTSKTDIIEFDYYVFNDTNREFEPRNNCPSVISGDGQEVFCSWMKSGFYHGMIWTRAVSRDLILSNQIFFYPEIYHQDAEWSPKIFAYAKSVCYFQHVLYVYRIREGSISAQNTARRYMDFMFCLVSLYKFSCLNWLSSEYVNTLREKISSRYFTILYRIKIEGNYNFDLISALEKHKYIIKDSSLFHRRYLYRYLHTCPR